MIKAVGAIPVGMSIIQGTLNGWNANKIFKITPLLKSTLSEPYGVRSFFLGINRKIYDALPAKSRRIIDRNSGEKVSLDAAMAFAEMNKMLIKKARANPKYTIVSFPPAEQKKRAAMFQKFHREWIKKTPDGQKKYDTLQRILADIRKGG